jgi:hypothetical protein
MRVASRDGGLTATTPQAAVPVDEGPWNPGISSQVPEDILHLATIFRSENVFNDLASVTEMQDFTGLERRQLVVFRPQRLVLHELLIRVMADVSVNDGARIEDLGINFRHMTDAILTRYVEPRMGELVAAYEDIDGRLRKAIQMELTRPPAPAKSEGENPPPWWKRFRRQPLPPAESIEEAGPHGRLQAWEHTAASDADPLQRAACRALARLVSALVARHGGMWGSPELLVQLAAGLACNEYGSEELGRRITPWIAEACASEGFVLLPMQTHPHVMNTKGASASGKSTMRPLQKELADRIGARWADFALISPDVWRKRLLDYGSLGPHYKYAGAFTGDEIHLIDQKLDRHMARKAEEGGMSHLLIDRFRFDSFAPDSDEAGSNLLTRFGHVLYLFFMVTPPASTVERSWNRGLEIGRYKAVDDLLAHNVEAYAGIPQLFFTWAKRDDKRVHYEFLDNSVAQGESPLTMAFGWNREMNVLDVKRMLDVVRYQRLDINAKEPGELFPDAAAIAAEHCLDFLQACVRELAVVNFAEQATGRVYLRVEAGHPVRVDREALAHAAEDDETRAALRALAPQAFEGTVFETGGGLYLQDIAREKPIPTLGRWGSARRLEET